MKNIQSKLPSLGLIILLIGFHRISETIYTPALPDLAKGLIGDQGAEFTISFYFIGFAIGILLWGVIADVIGRRSAMLSGLVLYVLGCWSCYEADSLVSLLGSRFIQALGASAGSVVTQTIIRDLYSGNRRNQIFSIVGGYLSLILVLSPLVGGWIDGKSDWHGNFALLILMGLILLVYAFLRLPETQINSTVSKTENLGTFKRVTLQFMKDKQVVGYAILMGICNGMLFIYYTEAPFLFIDILHYTTIQYSVSAGFVGLAIVCASCISHRMNANGFKGDFIIKIGCYTVFLATIGLVISTLAGVFDTSSMFNLTSILGLVSVLFIGVGLIIPNALGQAILAYQYATGTASALFGLFYYLLIAGFTLLMGMFHDGTALPMPLYFLALAILMLVIHYTCLRPQFGLNQTNKSIP